MKDIFQENMRLYLGISIGVFLFILFFQPFSLDPMDPNNILIFDAGFGAIIFIFIFIIRVAFYRIIQDFRQSNYHAVLPYYVGSLFLFAFTVVAFIFYLRYVGSVNISFYLIFKVALICLAPTVILFLNDTFKELKKQNEYLIQKQKNLRKQIEEFEENYLNTTIEFMSANNSDNLNLRIKDIACIKSAENYIEIYYTEEDVLQKKLIRNTLKNLEHQLKSYSNFIRCHRTCIINVKFIDKLERNLSNHWITIKGYSEQIPVSRQYLLKVKENI